jgi:putative effector of murein hydrolase
MVKLSDSIGVSDGILALIVIVAAVMMFWIGEMAEKKFKREDISNEI